MATASFGKEFFGDLLTCTICLETFKVPKYLPCLHTFCETCIKTYILSTVKEETKNGFKCPVCRRSVKVDSGSPETWAKELPGNHLLLSMIDKQKIANAEKFCTACESKSKTEKAISWCTVCCEAYCKICEDCHTSFKMTAKHKIVPITEALNMKDDTFGNGEIVTCVEHPDRLIEVYCKDHSKPCCTICATVHHRKCDEVVTIDKATSGVKQSTKVKELSKRLKETNIKLGEILQSRKKVIVSFENETDTIFTNIGNLRKNINKHLDRVELKLRDKMQTTKKEVVLKLNDETSQLSSLNSMVENWKQIFETCLTHASDLQCLVKFEEILDKMTQIDDEILQVVDNMKDVSVNFVPNEQMLNIESLGQITLKNSEPLVYWEYGNTGKKFNFHTGKLNVVFVIDVQRGVTFVSGMFWSKDILLTDCCNSKIMKYDNKGILTHELNIPSPTDISNIDNNKAAVATNSTKVYIVNVASFVIDRELTLASNAWGLRFVGDQIIAASSGTVTWLDSSTGAKIKDFETSTDTRFVCCPKKKTDYIYTDTTHSIKYVSAEGKGFTYTDTSQLSYPYSQDIDCQGNIYTTGYNSKNIHQLTADGRLVRVIPITDIGKTISNPPWVLRFEENSNRFLLTFNGSNKVFICKID